MSKKMGRPEEYKEEMCDIVIELMAEGASKVEVAAELGLRSMETFYTYLKKHEDFDNAVKIGQLLSQSWWEKQGRKNIHNKEFNSGLWFMNMKNRFGWADKMQSEIKAVVSQDDWISKHSES